MADQTDEPRRPGFPGIDPRFMGRRPMRSWSLRVTEAFNVTPRMRRVRFTADDLGEMSFKPGQDLVLNLPQAHGDPARRHYTIRRLKDSTLEVDFVLHGDSPATRWAKNAQPATMIEAAGPRGRTSVNPQAARHIFVGDETCLPGIFAMAESLPASAKADILLEIATLEDKQELRSAAQIALTWIVRGQGSLLESLKALEPAPHNTHAYIIGETAQVRDQRHYLVERGFTREQITAEGYWRPGRVGGHDHV
jgi:NADPH-dependent ferric siderophore reductase